MGTATFEEPIVAVTFVATEGDIQWAKSGPAALELPVRLWIGRYDETGHDVQVGFGIDASRRSRTLLSDPGWMGAPMRGATLAQGRVHPMVRISGTPPVDCFALFLAGHAVRTGRNRLWNLRPKLRADAPEAIRPILSYGRCGRL